MAQVFSEDVKPSLLVVNQLLNWVGDYQFTLITPTLDPSIDWEALDQQNACLRLQHDTYFHGVITSIHCFSNENQDFFLQITLSSPLLKLHTLSKNQYFNDVPLSEVIQTFCSEANIPSDCLSFQLATKEVRHGFILQHQETDWQCFKRLIADQGWYVAIDNDKENYRIVITDLVPFVSNEVAVEVIPNGSLMSHQERLKKTATLIKYHHALSIKTFKVDRFSDLHPNQNLAADCHWKGSGLGRRYCFGGSFESQQQAMQAVTILQQASTCLSEYLIVELNCSLIAVGTTVKVQSHAYSWLADTYQVIAVKIFWQDSRYFPEPKQSMQLILIKKETIFRNALQETKPIDLIAATVIGLPEEKQLKEVGRYRVQLDNYQLKTANYPAVRMLYPLTGDATGFHFSLTPGTRLRIGFLYQRTYEPVILGAITAEQSIVTRSNHTSYRLKTAQGFEWQISEANEGHENSLSAPNESTGFILKQHANEAGIWFWSQGSKTIEAKGMIQMASSADHHQTHHEFKLKALAEHQISAQKKVSLRATISHHLAHTIKITTKEKHLVGEALTLSAKHLHCLGHADSFHFTKEGTYLQAGSGMSLSGAEQISLKVGSAELSIYSGTLRLRAPKIVLNTQTILTGMVSYA